MPWNVLCVISFEDMVTFKCQLRRDSYDLPVLQISLVLSKFDFHHHSPSTSTIGAIFVTNLLKYYNHIVLFCHICLRKCYFMDSTHSQMTEYLVPYKQTVFGTTLHRIQKRSMQRPYGTRNERGVPLSSLLFTKSIWRWLYLSLAVTISYLNQLFALPI